MRWERNHASAVFATDLTRAGASRGRASQRRFGRRGADFVTGHEGQAWAPPEIVVADAPVEVALSRR
jgi:hypothetical protein